ncbi:MAG: hypothetical protein PHS14_14540 [Elusimicrobia bacterium]|nr:hypothetical protein [Elusimicrobiota bacterium]
MGKLPGDVTCDACGVKIALGSKRALFVTVRGIEAKHLKRDFCNWGCFAFWAMREAQSPTPSPDPNL